MRVTNVILIVCDTLRRDHLSCYGNTWIRTPSIERFASMSVVFDRAYVHNFPTVPARTDMYTGRYTSAYLDWQPLPLEETVIADVLSRADFTTFLIGDTYNLFRDNYFFTRGFSGFEWIRGNGADRWHTSPRKIQLPAPPEMLYDVENYLNRYLRNAAHRTSESDYPTSRTMTGAAKWLEENYRGGPFFLHVDTFDPHEPWDPPRWYVDLYDPGYEGREIIMPRYTSVEGYLSLEELRHCRALYAACVSQVDYWLDHLLRKIEALKLLENTAIIFTTDHGFYLGEHGWIGKGRIDEDGIEYGLPLYDELAHVPLIVYVPGCRPRRVDALAQPVDIAPTIYDLVGVRRPDTVQGESWAPLLDGESTEIRPFAWSGEAVHHPGRWRPSTITTREWCLVFNGALEEPRPEWVKFVIDGIRRREIVPRSGEVPGLDLGPQLYHLPSDPAQARNVLHEKFTVARDLHRQYVAFLEELGVPEEAVALRRHL